MSFIVSRNYYDLSSPARWIYRQANIPIGRDNYRAVNALVANGVNFMESGNYEQGFGCNVIAKVDEVVALSEEDLERMISDPSLKPITFALDSFKIRGTEEYIDQCDRLYLCADGSMYIRQLQPSPVEEQPVPVTD